MNKYINKLFMMSAIAMAGIMGMTSCTDYLNKLRKVTTRIMTLIRIL